MIDIAPSLMMSSSTAPTAAKGIASEMLDKMLKRMQHIEEIMLDCAPELEGFYGRFGFQAKESSSMLLKNQS